MTGGDSKKELMSSIAQAQVAKGSSIEPICKEKYKTQYIISAGPLSATRLRREVLLIALYGSRILSR